MKTKTALDLNTLHVETFETANLVVVAEAEKGTACWELCAADPTSDPDADSCGPHKCV
ncbi:hypothetical protein [Longimicrobium sp.]|uniref:hypothetical protein n=1 Tax=Longimicrobium sp. TaxID=2029185 RepID=UPI002ED78734